MVYGTVDIPSITNDAQNNHRAEPAVTLKPKFTVVPLTVALLMRAVLLITEVHMDAPTRMNMVPTMLKNAARVKVILCTMTPVMTARPAHMVPINNNQKAGLVRPPRYEEFLNAASLGTSVRVCTLYRGGVSARRTSIGVN